MSDYYDDDEDERRPPRPAAEGVRIIGAEEAARALEEGQAAGRRPEDAPRFGDVPRPPEGPRPGYRFPLPESVDPASAVPRPPVVAPDYEVDAADAGGHGHDEYEPYADEEGGWEPHDSGPPTQQVELPHWTEPPSGEVPRILVGEEGEDDDLGAWAGLAGQGPRWRDSQSDWEDADFEDDLLGGDDEVRLGALDQTRTEHSDMFSFDEPEPEPEPVYDEYEPEPAPPPRRTVTTSIRTRPAPDYQAPAHGGRDMGTAVGVGLALAAAALICFKVGPALSMVLVVAVLTLAAIEVFDVLRRAGYKPATLLGISATVSMLLAAYNKGETAVPLVLSLTVVFGFLWYLFDVIKARPTINLAATYFGFLWVGFLGCFAALLLQYPKAAGGGPGALLGAIVCTVAYDVGGLFIGSNMGRRPLMPHISPNKTVEGLLGGMGMAIIAGAFFGAIVHPWSFGGGLKLGLVVAVAAPLGDLAESMIKRDLGIKDMGTLLPGHGGVLDRFDALLFVLPASYYLLKLLKLG